jgi:gluconolactonase
MKATAISGFERDKRRMKPNDLAKADDNMKSVKNAPSSGTQTGQSVLQRRAFLSGAITAALPIVALAQQNRSYEQNAPPMRYPDPDILVLDKRFAKYKVANASIQRLHTGMLWSEGPAWSGVGGYLVWSDIPSNAQLRWLAEDGHISIMRRPANNANGNTFDWEGRLISCEHATRRVVRYERDGTTSVLADKWNNKPLNAPNDVVVHPDGGIWFTDPGYGSLGNYEGNKGELYIKEAIYRIDPKTAKIDIATDEMFKPNGLCFSPDYKQLYVAETGSSHYPRAPRNIMIWDVIDGKSLRNGREFASMKLKMKAGEFAGLADGIRADVDGNVWAGAGWVGEGYDGVHIFAPDGQRIGQILLPEICANICFGEPKRNRLFMTASRSLYAVYVEAQGAHIA